MARLSRIAPELPAANLAASIAFYDKLGFTLAVQFAQQAYAIVDRDGITIHLFEDKLRRAAPVGVHLFTHELTELFEEFTDRGVHIAQKIERKPWGNRDFRVRDDYGNELKFTEPRIEDE